MSVGIPVYKSPLTCEKVRKMKSIFFFFIIALILISCSASPSAKFAQPTLEATDISQSANALPPSLTASPARELAYTNTTAPTAIIAKTITLTPSNTPTPTEDLSFYNVAACLPKTTTYQRGTVTQVIDGDTIDVLLEDGNIVSVRYIGIDAPEIDLPYSAEASQANSDLVLQKEIILIKDKSDLDQYNRLLRYIIVDHVFINLELVRTGFAKAENYPPDIACAETFTSAEIAARTLFAGLWTATQTPEASAPQVIVLAVNKREEWVDIKNVGESDVDLAGWNLVSERGHQECPLSGKLAVEEILRIWAGTTQGAGFSCGYTSPIWNNSETDPAVLYNAQGVEVSRK
jgi:endonuclease YncB( thermonuclease family)